MTLQRKEVMQQFVLFKPMDRDFCDRFSSKVRQLRGDQSQLQFARLLGVTQPTIAAWENGSIPNLENIEKLAELYAVKPEEFIAEMYGRAIVTETKEPIEDQIKKLPVKKLASLLMMIAVLIGGIVSIDNKDSDSNEKIIEKQENRR
ncbi:putative transcriptional regulator [Synechococcus sp. PCC 7502]|uniref:helix-turn-helix transcriptional regulator n=1 Tax=Synechococcus sp. PCC 7502 TaxID=1173263 RepID=UPI00029F8BF8|nr:helix-turn-helix transcriptional regulator [Synechococcus sp. PCC 7502]AFY74758.1 putative transcriptional regulator [Synechococcus sp. PCC 7502]